MLQGSMILLITLYPIFSYVILSYKRIDFDLWCKIIKIMENNGHKDMEGLKEILSIKGSLNLGLSTKILEAFPDLKIIDRPSLDIFLWED